jgi:hypothetical protein
MRLSRFVAIGLFTWTLLASNVGAASSAAAGSVQLDSQDAATADGSVRCGLHSGKIYAVLTGLAPNVVLSPDSWSSDDESKSWTAWLSDFDNALFANWEDAQSGEGQETVRVRISNGSIQTEAGHYLSPTGTDNASFNNAIKRSLEKTLSKMPAMPVTKNPLKEVRYVATFMCDSKVVPRYGREQLGLMAALTPNGDNIVVHARLKDGRAPGIQILSDKDGGTINVTDVDQFLQKSRTLP